MEKLNFYFKLGRIEKMVAAILTKFNKDLIISGIGNGSVLSSSDHKLMINMDDKVITHVGQFIEYKHPEEIVWKLIQFNEEYDFGWDVFLTALELAAEEIQQLKKANIE